jgi:hypothetical protein
MTRALVSEIIKDYAESIEVAVCMAADGSRIDIGDYRFNRAQFLELVAYVLRGGYPRWKDDIMPSYAADMKDKVYTRWGNQRS